VKKRAVPLRSLVALAIGLLMLGAILYYASTVDLRGPTIRAISLTQHLAGDTHQALTTSSIEVDFSEAVDHASAQEAFAISPEVAGAFSWSAAVLTFTPLERLPLRTDFEVSIGPGIHDKAGNLLGGLPPPFAFTTVGNPTVVLSDPAEAATEVALDAAIQIRFSTLMDTASVERAVRLSPDLDVRMRWSREELTIVPAQPLEPNRRYTLTIGVEARDQAGTPLERAFRLAFRTAPSGLAPEAIVPSDGVAGIAVTTPVAIVFDRPLDPESVNEELLTISPDVAGSLDVIASPGAAGMGDGSSRVLRFQPSGPLDPNTTYEVTLEPGLLGADGAGLPAGVSWTFTTGAPTATLSNQVLFLSDRAGIANLWAMNPDGSNQRQLSAELSPVTGYSVQPDGRAYVTGDGSTIVFQRADGSARRLLTDPDLVEFDAAYSPDGTQITFARADPELGTGLGLWTRDADGSDPRPIELPSAATASPSTAEAEAVPLLRAPRMSPDGTAVAFVDEAGRVAILDLELRQLAVAPFDALSEPVWLPDGSGVLVAGLAVGPRGEGVAYQPHTPVQVLDPASRRSGAEQLAAVHVVQFNRFATAVSATAFGAGAVRPAVAPDGGFAFIRLEGGMVEGGSLWVTSALEVRGEPVLPDIDPPASSASFAPEPGALLVARLGDGVWLVSLEAGSPRKLSGDGWLPRWLP
jgi:Bacterial Ig-like domain